MHKTRQCPDCKRRFAHRNNAHTCLPSNAHAVIGHVTGSLRLSPKRASYKVLVSDIMEVDLQLEGWILEAYALATAKVQSSARGSGPKRS
jgi:hypothetical protein